MLDAANDCVYRVQALAGAREEETLSWSLVGHRPFFYVALQPLALRLSLVRRRMNSNQMPHVCIFVPLFLCIAAWNQLPKDGGGVRTSCPKEWVWKFSLLITDYLLSDCLFEWVQLAT